MLRCQSTISDCRHATRPGEIWMPAGARPARISRHHVVRPMFPTSGLNLGQSNKVSGCCCKSSSLQCGQSTFRTKTQLQVISRAFWQRLVNDRQPSISHVTKSSPYRLRYPERGRSFFSICPIVVGPRRVTPARPIMLRAVGRRLDWGLSGWRIEPQSAPRSR